MHVQDEQAAAVPTRVLVAGAGIAGLAMANALSRIGGFEVELVDPDPRPVGVAVGLSSCALRALDGIDVLEPVLAASAPSMALHMCTADGTTLVHTVRETPEGQPYPDNVIVDRLSLTGALAASVMARGVRIRTGVAAAGIELVDGGAIVDLVAGVDGGRSGAGARSGADERPGAGVPVGADRGSGEATTREHFDLVVGADGIGSRLRASVFAQQPRDLEQLGLRWTTGPVEGLDHGIMYLAPRAVKLGLWPLRDGSVYAFLTLPRPGLPRASRAEVLAELRDALESFTFPGADGLRAQVPWDDVHIAPFQTLAPPAPWRNGRLVLAGDAVHVMPPHGSSGAAMAIEDAFVLADELAKRSLDQALDAYGQRREARVRRVVEYSTDNCAAENRAAVEGTVPTMDPGEAQRFWEFLRTAP